MLNYPLDYNQDLATLDGKIFSTVGMARINSVDMHKGYLHLSRQKFS